jgi:hypothetical protein
VLTAEQVRQELGRYEHPLLCFDAETDTYGRVVMLIRLHQPVEGIDPYRIVLHERDVAGPQFTWNLQRLLYDCIHDFVAEMFVRTPQSR